MALSMNFVNAADRSTSTQHEIINLFSSSVSSLQSNNTQIFQLDGRSFHPVFRYEDDILTSTDPEWDLHMELEPIPLTSPLFPQQGMDDSGMTSSSSQRNTHITDCESSDSSSVSSQIFIEASANGAIESSPAPFSECFPQLVQALEPFQRQQLKLHRQVTEASASTDSIQNCTARRERQLPPQDNQSLAAVVAGQDHRFKPFHEEKWNQRYQELLVFHSQHGHVAVPHTYPPNQQLARWIKRQRRQYKLLQEGKQATLTPERLEMLNNLGFIWDSHDVNWREKYQSLVSYKETHGDCNVPSNYKDKKLATWVKCQRRQHKLYIDKRASSMTPERIVDLNKIGFLWEIRQVVAKTETSTIDRVQKQVEPSKLAVTLQKLPDFHVRMVPPSA